MAGVGHELRTPLGALSAALDVIALTANPNPMQNEACAVAARQMQQLSLLLEDLQDVLAAREGHMQVRQVPLDFSQLARLAWEALAHSARGHAFTRQIAPDLQVMADPRRMRRAIERLFWRVQQVAAPGMPLHLAVSVQGGLVSVEVHGVPRGDTAQAQGKAAPLPLDLHGHAGSPAALADLLADHVIRLHGGRIASPSDAGGPRLVLPCLHEAPPAFAGSRRPTVLVALHDAEDRRTAAQALARQGYLVVESTLAPSVLDLLLQDVPDLVLASAHPAREACQLASAAREAGYAGRMVAVATTTASAPDALDAPAAQRAGFDTWTTWADWPRALIGAKESGND